MVQGSRCDHATEVDPDHAKGFIVTEENIKSVTSFLTPKLPIDTKFGLSLQRPSGYPAISDGKSCLKISHTRMHSFIFPDTFTNYKWFTYVLPDIEDPLEIKYQHDNYDCLRVGFCAACLMLHANPPQVGTHQVDLPPLIMYNGVGREICSQHKTHCETHKRAADGLPHPVVSLYGGNFGTKTKDEYLKIFPNRKKASKDLVPAHCQIAGSDTFLEVAKKVIFYLFLFSAFLVICFPSVRLLRLAGRCPWSFLGVP